MPATPSEQPARSARSAEQPTRSAGQRRTVLPTLLLPAGMAVFAFGSATAAGPYAWAGLAVAIAGALLLPAGTWRAAPGPPRYLALLAVVSFGFFGAHSMLTVIATRADGVALGWVSVALGIAAVCWSTASLAQPRLCGRDGRRTETVLRGGVLVMAGASGSVVALEAVGRLTGPGILLWWAIAGAGMGLAYPTMYLKSITPAGAESGSSSGVAAALATGVILAESIGSVIGTAAGSATVDAAQRLGRTEAGGLHAAMAGFAASLVLAAGLAVLGGRRDPAADGRGRLAGHHRHHSRSAPEDSR